MSSIENRNAPESDKFLNQLSYIKKAKKQAILRTCRAVIVSAAIATAGTAAGCEAYNARQRNQEIEAQIDKSMPNISIKLNDIAEKYSQLQTAIMEHENNGKLDETKKLTRSRIYEDAHSIFKEKTALETAVIFEKSKYKTESLKNGGIISLGILGIMFAYYSAYSKLRNNIRDTRSKMQDTRKRVERIIKKYRSEKTDASFDISELDKFLEKLTSNECGFNIDLINKKKWQLCDVAEDKLLFAIKEAGIMVIEDEESPVLLLKLRGKMSAVALRDTIAQNYQGFNKGDWYSPTGKIRGKIAKQFDIGAARIGLEGDWVRIRPVEKSKTQTADEVLNFAENTALNAPEMYPSDEIEAHFISGKPITYKRATYRKHFNESNKY